METDNTQVVVEATPVEETTPVLESTTTEETTPPQEVVAPKEEEASYEEIVEQLVAYIDELEVKQQDFNKQLEENTSLLAEKDQSLGQLNEQLKELNDLKTTIDAIESAWTKVSTHDIIGPIAEMLVKGEDIDIPKYIESLVVDKIKAMPQFVGEPKTQVKEEKPKTSLLNERLKNTPLY